MFGATLQANICINLYQYMYINYWDVFLYNTNVEKCSVVLMIGKYLYVYLSFLLLHWHVNHMFSAPPSIHKSTYNSQWKVSKVVIRPGTLHSFWINLTQGKLRRLRIFVPLISLNNPYLIIPWVTNDNSEHWCELVSGTCFRVLGTLLFLHEHCPYITYYCFCCQSFIIILQKC